MTTASTADNPSLCVFFTWLQLVPRPVHDLCAMPLLFFLSLAGQIYASRRSCGSAILRDPMIILDAQTVARLLPRGKLIDELNKAFRAPVVVPQRAHHDIAPDSAHPGTLLMMPAWSEKHIGVKIVSVFPANASLGLPAVSGSYLLLDGTTGQPLAMLDGAELTLQRTAAASALASSFLSREDASELLMVGTGSLAPHLIEAHATVRDLRRVRVWGRRRSAAKELAANLLRRFDSIELVDDLETAVESADIISCATTSAQPLIKGKWLQPGQHLDLVGAFKADMAEADIEAIARSSVYVDTRAGALSEAGEIVQSIAAGRFSAEGILGSLRDLTAGTVTGRQNADEITVFKSVGTALEDLAAAELAVETWQRTAT